MPEHLPIIPEASSSSGPLLRALEELWNEVSEKPLYASPNFWRYLRLLKKMSLRFQDVDDCKIITPKWKTNDCSTCTDICCVGPHSTVTLGFRDMATLVDINRASLISSHKPHFDTEVLSNRPALQRHVSSTSFKRFPTLKQNAMGACAALSQEGKCTLYPNWPLSCARFPYSLNVETRQIFYSRRCDSFWIRRDSRSKVEGMALAAVASYNEKIKDLVLLEYAPDKLEQLGLMKFLTVVD